MPLSRETIVNLGSNLPPSLGVFGRLQKLLDEPDTDLTDIVELVQIDSALTFQVIKLANSALYGLRSHCDSLDDAVSRVGFGDIHQIVGLAVSRHSFQGELALYGMAAGRLWENAVAVASLSKELAQCADADSRGAHAAGLMRNLGKVVLNNQAQAIRYPGEETEPDVQAWEKKTYGFGSDEVTSILLDHWRFAPEMVGAMCCHRLADPTGEFAGGAARMHLACALVVEWGVQLTGEATGWRTDDQLLATAGIERGQLGDVIARARAQFSKCAMIEWSRAA